MDLLMLSDPSDIMLMVDEGAYQELKELEYAINIPVVESISYDDLDRFIEDEEEDDDDEPDEEVFELTGIFDTVDADGAERAALGLSTLISADDYSLDCVLDIIGL